MLAFMLNVRMFIQLVLGVEREAAQPAVVAEAVREVDRLKMVDHMRLLTELARAEAAGVGARLLARLNVLLQGVLVHWPT